MADVFIDASVVQPESEDVVTVTQTSFDASEAVPNAVSTTPHARFPPELWAMTINHMRDRKSQSELAYLWTTVRRVSKDFEREIEKLFLEEHIGKTWIYADCGLRCVDCRTFSRIDTRCQRVWKDSLIRHGDYCDFGNASFSFSSLEVGNESRAFFKYSKDGSPDYEDSKHSVLHGLLFRWSNNDRVNPPLNSRVENEATTEAVNTESNLSYEKLPIFLVQVRGGLIDSEVPIFRLDIANQTMLVNWRALFTDYFDQYLAGVRQMEKDAAFPLTSEESAASRRHMKTLNRNLRCLDRSGQSFETSFATSAWQSDYMQKQLRAYRTCCGDTIEDKNGLSTEKLRKRRIANFEMFLNDDGLAAPGNTFHPRTITSLTAKIKADMGRIRLVE